MSDEKFMIKIIDTWLHNYLTKEEFKESLGNKLQPDKTVDYETLLKTLATIFFNILDVKFNCFAPHNEYIIPSKTKQDKQPWTPNSVCQLSFDYHA